MTGPLRRITSRGNMAQQGTAKSVAITKAIAPRRLTGVVTAVDSAGNVTVNIDGVSLAGLTVSSVPLQVGDVVTVLRQSGHYFVLGLALAETVPLTATVNALPVNTNMLSLTTPFGTLSAGWVASYAPAIGDSVYLLWQGSTPLVIGKVGVNGNVPTPGLPKVPPLPMMPVTPATTALTFAPVDSGTCREGVWLLDSQGNGNVIQGTLSGANSGAWFYGGKPGATLSTKTIRSAAIWLSRTQGGTAAPQTVHLSRVTNDTRPGGALTFDAANATDSISLAVGAAGWYPIPTSIAQALATLGGSLGVTSADPLVRLLGTANHGQAGALKLTWQ